MFSRGIEKEQWYVFKGYRKRAVVCFQGVQRKSSGMFSRGIEKEQWYLFKGYRERAMVCFQGV